MMKWISTCFLLLFVGTGLLAQKQVPDVKLKTLKKQTVSLHSALQEADYTVLSFWATWCAPCKRELNTIAEVYDDWQKQYNMQLIAVTIDDQRMLSKVPAMVATNWWEYPVLADEDASLRNAINVTSIPRTFIVDREGTILYDHSGYKPGDEIELEEKLSALAKARR
ncbi:MAG TPA: TlpA disulfide reductase family protein [Saprospiraceae bacterium]|nr:TlpA disulfide reductase family protein [Saprospiraceae bacterium]